MRFDNKKNMWLDLFKKVEVIEKQFIPKQVEESLSIFDVDGDGWISRGQIKHLMCSQTGEGLTEDEFEDLLDNIPGNEDGMIRVSDFTHLLTQGGLPRVTDL